MNIKNVNWSKCNNVHLLQYRLEIEIEKQVTSLFTNHKLDDLTPDMINSDMINAIRQAEEHLLKSKFNNYAKSYWCFDLKHAHARARHFRCSW